MNFDNSKNKNIEETIKKGLLENFESKRKRIFSKFFGAALGSIPWIGGFLSAIIDFKSDENQIKNNELYKEWLNEHSNKISYLGNTLVDIAQKIDNFSEDVEERIQSEEYLQIVRKAFKSWDNSETYEKRELIRKLLINAGTQRIITDDLIRLYLNWIDLYHEIHFSIIKIIYENQNITRNGIWQKLGGKNVREDSLEADLFRLLIRDLSTGSVIRQYRQTDYYGNFIQRTRSKSNSSGIMKSAFDDGESYELTELGKNFVHYTMNEVVKKIE